LGRVHLIERLIVALLQVDDGAVARTADLDHGEPVRGGVRQGDHSVEEPGSRDGEANSRLPRDEAGDGRRVAGGLLVLEADVANAFGLSEPREVGHRNACYTEDRVEPVELQGVDSQVKAVR